MPTVDDLPRGFQIRGRRTIILLRVTGHDTETDAQGQAVQVITAENGGDMVEFLTRWPRLVEQFRVGDVLRVEVERIGGQERRGDFTQPDQRQRNPRRPSYF